VFWHVLGRLLVRARSACNIPSSGCTYIPPQHDRCCRRRHQRHGRIQERSGLEIYTVPCATISLLPRRRAPSSRRVGFGRFSLSTTSTTPRTSPFPNPRGPLVSVWSRSGRIRKLLPQLRVCVFRLVAMVRIWYTCSLGRLNLLNFLLRHNALVGGHPGPRKKKQMNNPFYSLSTRRLMVQVIPTRARNIDTWDRRHIVSNMR
jgi:hypothetical protein